MNGVLAVFGTGVLASLSPCVYPLLPITLGFLGTQAGAGPEAGRGRARVFRVLAYALGQTAALVAIGATAVALGETLGFTSESRAANAAMAALLLGAGLVSLGGRLPSLPSPMRRAWQVLGIGPRSSTREEAAAGSARSFPLLGAFTLGAGSAVVASPCTSPILAGVLAMLASSSTLAQGILLMTAYSLGFSSLFLLLGMGLLNLRRLPRSGRWLLRVQKAGAVALLGGGLYYGFRAFS